MHGAETVFKKPETTPSVLKGGRGQRFRGLSHRKQMHPFHALTFLPLSVHRKLDLNCENSTPPFPCCVWLPRLAKAALFKEKQHRP